MAHFIASRLLTRLRPISVSQLRFKYNPNNPGLPCPKDGIEETDEEFDQRYVNYFKRDNIDGWEVRKGINDMHGMDLVPDPQVIIAVLNACRRVNDHSLAVRYLEAVRCKACGNKEILDYIESEIRPTLVELGISALTEMGYDKPELALGDPSRCSLHEGRD